RDADGRVKLHADIAHPINSACREVIQSAVLKAYQLERERSKQPGYVCTYDDFDSDYDVPLSSVGGEMTASTGRGYRTHGAHTPAARRPPGRAAPATAPPGPRSLANTRSAPITSAPASSENTVSHVAPQPQARSLQLRGAFHARFSSCCPFWLAFPSPSHRE